MIVLSVILGKNTSCGLYNHYHGIFPHFMKKQFLTGEKKMEQYININHTFAPVYNENSKILILGTFPSVKSRENNFYYGHPQNRFWKIIAALTQSELPVTIEEKKQLLLKNRIAIWDVIQSCSITGSGDASIRDVVPNDLSGILENTKIEKIYANGNKAYELYMKYSYRQTGMDIEKLPSTSPANAAYSLEKLLEKWKVLQTTGQK
jgi:hypoxanthine-DNA glycosylase